MGEGSDASIRSECIDRLNAHIFPCISTGQDEHLAFGLKETAVELSMVGQIAPRTVAPTRIKYGVLDEQH